MKGQQTYGSKHCKPKLDVIFKKLFTDKNNEDILRDFISSLLEIPCDSIKKIIIQNPEIIPESISGKFSRLDLRMQVDNKLINVEMQVKRESDYKDRALFYWSKLYAGELKSGEEYEKLMQSITINILSYNMFEDSPEYHTEVATMIKNSNEIFSDKFRMHFFELKKINNKITGKDKMEIWLQLINAESEEELDMIQQSQIPELQKAVMIIHEMSEDEKIQEMARIREKALHDEASALKTAKQEGIQEGIIKTARMMIQNNIPDKMIAECTKLSVEEINELKNN